MASSTQTADSLSDAESLYFQSDLLDLLEDLEEYRAGGYHPTLIDDTFKDGRYTVVHKLGYGSYSTIWLARDNQLHRFVSLKISRADAASSSTSELKILRLLQGDGDATDASYEGKRFIPPLLDDFAIEGPNGCHSCLVGEPAGLSLAASKELHASTKFPVESARSIAAQLAMGLSYIHSRGVCHGDLHMRNVLLRIPSLDHLDTKNLYKLHEEPFREPIKRKDEKDPRPLAPTHAIYAMDFEVPADEIMDPEIIIIDYGTSFVLSEEPEPKLYTPALYLPPEDFFDEPITQAADVWTLGVSLYEILGGRPLFETFMWDRDDIISEMVSMLGPLPSRWWDSWGNRGEFFRPDGSWIPAKELRRGTEPVARPLSKRMWDMERGETVENCEWDVEGGEVEALEELLNGMLAFEPAQRFTSERVLASDYVTKWAMPAWERQMQRKENK